jgi:hypothetical protein
MNALIVHDAFAHNPSRSTIAFQAEETAVEALKAAHPSRHIAFEFALGCEAVRPHDEIRKVGRKREGSTSPKSE